MKLAYDHAYTEDPKHRFLKRLSKLGFEIQPGHVEHPGALFCRFIAFKLKPTDPLMYLEFVDARKKPQRVPGLSFRSPRSLGTFQKALTSRKMSSKLAHKNYEWKADSKSRLPGWNFLTFPNAGFRTPFIWLTEYEMTPERLRRKRKITKHPNSVFKVHAIELNANRRLNTFLGKLFAKKMDRPVTLEGGQKLYVTQASRSKFTAIVLEAKSLKKASQFMGEPTEIWRGQPAIRIRNPQKMWDLLIIGK